MNQSSASVISVRRPDGSVMTLNVVGHNMLTRRVEYDLKDFLFDTPKIATEDADGMARLLQDSLTQGKWVHLVEVLAVGGDCGTDRDAKRRKVKYGYAKHINNPARPGDLVALPEFTETGRMWRACTGNDADVMVDEGEAFFIVPREHRPDWETAKAFYDAKEAVA